MTVRDLIAALGRLDPTLPVIMVDETVDFCEVEAALEDLACPSRHDGGCFELCDERDKGAVRVVRLFGGADQRAPAVG